MGWNEPTPSDPPPKILHPVGGEISHKKFPEVHAPLPELGTDFPLLLVFVNVTFVFWQTVSFGEIVKLAWDFSEIRIPPIVPGVSPHGFEIKYSILYVLFEDAPQLVVLNV